jgi:hypothetical protein
MNLVSCSKTRTWQELGHNDNNELTMLQVQDLGLAKSTRRKKRTHKKKNKPQESREVVRSQEKHQHMKKSEVQDNVNIVKMTSMPKKVKPASTPRRQPTSQTLSPLSKNLKRLKQGNRNNIAARQNVIRQKLFESPRIPAGVKPLISKWEEMCKVNLTPAVPRTPKLRENVDSQSKKVLENLQKSST